MSGVDDESRKVYMNILQLKENCGIYSASIDITVDEWKEMLVNEYIFNQDRLKMIFDWYRQPFHQATSKEIMCANNIQGGTPYNGIVVGLGRDIIKHLGRFEVLDISGKGRSYFIIVFEGWYENYKKSGNFIWKLRDELIQAIEELELIQNTAMSPKLQEDSDNISILKEGEKISYYTTKYERKPQNRKAAINLHGTKCQICGFDFEEVYGEHGKGFIEVHHLKSLHEINEETEIDPKTDLICICSNCHRMIHHRKRGTLTPDQLKDIMQRKKRNL